MTGRNVSPRRGWVEHKGDGVPAPIGTPVEVRMFNGDVQTFVVGGATFGLDGAAIERSRGRWNGWDHSDGGPMGPKFKAYRLLTSAAAEERNTALFRSWLKVRGFDLC